jgi:hypothetical protein
MELVEQNTTRLGDLEGRKSSFSQLISRFESAGRAIVANRGQLACTTWHPYTSSGPHRRAQGGKLSAYSLMLTLTLPLSRSRTTPSRDSSATPPLSFHWPSAPPTQPPPSIHRAHSSTVTNSTSLSHQRQCSSLGEHPRANVPSL